MPTAYADWKTQLLKSVGSVSPDVKRMGDYVLELLWRDGCEPTMGALLDYAQAGLCRHFDIRASDPAQDIAPW
jgi:hypothetical protein